MDQPAPYIRASRKQLDYLDYLCSELGVTNRSLYEKYSMAKATKEIDRLKRKLEKEQKRSRQLVLL